MGVCISKTSVKSEPQPTASPLATASLNQEGTTKREVVAPQISEEGAMPMNVYVSKTSDSAATIENDRNLISDTPIRIENADNSRENPQILEEDVVPSNIDAFKAKQGSSATMEPFSTLITQAPVPVDKADKCCKTEIERGSLPEDKGGRVDEMKLLEASLLMRERSIVEKELELQKQLQRAENIAQLQTKVADPAIKPTDNDGREGSSPVRKLDRARKI